MAGQKIKPFQLPTETLIGGTTYIYLDVCKYNSYNSFDVLEKKYSTVSTTYVRWMYIFAIFHYSFSA